MWIGLLFVFVVYVYAVLGVRSEHCACSAFTCHVHLPVIRCDHFRYDQFVVCGSVPLLATIWPWKLTPICWNALILCQGACTPYSRLHRITEWRLKEALTMFLQVLTGDTWAEAIANPIAEQLPGIQIYFGEKTVKRQ